VRIAAHTYAFRDRPLGEALDAIRALGFDHVEVWLGHVDGTAVEVARAVERSSLVAVAVSAGGFYTADAARARRAVDVAHALGTPVVVGCLRPAVAAEVVAAIDAAHMLCVENHWDQELAVPKEVCSLIDSQPRLRACLDTGHAILAGVRPDRFADDLGDRLAHVHLKDALFPRRREVLLGRRLRMRLLGKPSPVIPGEGQLDLPRFLGALARIDYGGSLTLEHEGDDPEQAMAALLELLRQALAEQSS
jgi:sugar phosphate isomerase/epimerase